MTHEARRALLLAMEDFHYCPVTNQVIESAKHDDKAFCPCGQSNPKLTEMGQRESPGVHIKRLMKTASVDDYMKQEETRRGIDG